MAEGDESKHKRGDYRAQFCAVPSVSPCGIASDCENYRDACKSETDTWADHSFLRKIKSLANPFEKSYEAHHILCVSPVSKKLLGAPATSKIYGVVSQTNWCINFKTNMMAMPLWGHTVKYYCQVTSQTTSVTEALAAGAALLAPGWKDIPQHDIDHNSKEGYTWEISQKMETIAAKVEKAKHTISGDSLRGTLDSWSNKFRAELKRRGGRKGGTHEAWKQAQKDPTDSTWVHPFSMASDGKISEQAFPVRNFSEKVASWIDRIASAMQGAAH